MPDAARPGELVATLTLLRERIAKLAARSRLSLAATKRELVEPLLAALGWQTGDPESVRAPYRPPGGSRRLDYALLVYAQPALAISVRPLLRALESEELAVQLEAVKQNGDALQYFKRAWIKETKRKITIEEIENELGFEVEIVKSKESK